MCLTCGCGSGETHIEGDGTQVHTHADGTTHSHAHGHDHAHDHGHDHSHDHTHDHAHDPVPVSYTHLTLPTSDLV